MSYTDGIKLRWSISKIYAVLIADLIRAINMRYGIGFRGNLGFTDLFLINRAGISWRFKDAGVRNDVIQLLEALLDYDHRKMVSLKDLKHTEKGYPLVVNLFEVDEDISEYVAEYVRAIYMRLNPDGYEGNDELTDFKLTSRNGFRLYFTDQIKREKFKKMFRYMLSGQIFNQLQISNLKSSTTRSSPFHLLKLSVYHPIKKVA